MQEKATEYLVYKMKYQNNNLILNFDEFNINILFEFFDD